MEKRKIHWKNWKTLCNPKEEGGSGFHSLAEFNTAMLAKQAWRVVNNPNSLVARLFKARYFPDSSFCMATAHNSPSYSWRSIFSTCDLLLHGSYWQVGDGLLINVVTDAWIPRVLDFKPNAGTISPSGVWNEGLVRAIFTPNEAHAILAIPLSSDGADMVVWRLEKEWYVYCEDCLQVLFFSFSISPSF